MRKAIFVLAALMMLFSGVAAVSAYEAHVINVTAHVENALDVQTDNVTFGVMFPQEWNKQHRYIKLSKSAAEELSENIEDPRTYKAGDLKRVEFQIFAERKVDDQIPANHLPDVTIDKVDYYAWLGNWLWVGWPTPKQTENPMFEADKWAWVGPPPVGDNLTKELPFTANITDNTSQDLAILFCAPVFREYYNEHTDVKPDWWPADWAPIEKDDAEGRWIPDGVDLGLDLKIQVIDIERR
jgi:hypothetical protein